ncbi:MAG TPA: branched-chain amino acid aminotransferase, partial [Cytophagales bacterium]|nr:branched-chain amino acid aminotransferase [Cytophagales bacterium]
SIVIEKSERSNIGKVDFKNLGFGKVFTDHLFEVDYVDGQWQTPKVVPFHNLSLHPATSFIHYGQTIFEGLKAFKDAQGDILVFRPKSNWERMNKSAERVCMPAIPEELFIGGLDALLKTDQSWFPQDAGTSMYIRPFMFSLDAEIRVRPSDSYKFMIIISPSGAYYSEPVKVTVEKHYVRASNGGLGFAKTAANYAASLLPAKKAVEKGYHQLIWTDSAEHKYIEEAGTMNFMFVIDGKLITPQLSDSILAGVTRDSIIQLARDLGVTVEERKVSVEEVISALKNGKLQDAFGAGTAATVSHIIQIAEDGVNYDLPPVENRDFSNKVADLLNNIKLGKAADPHNWIHKIKL